MRWSLIDIHAHVNFNAFRDDGDAVIMRARGEGVGMILVGSQYDTSARALEYARHYPTGVWAAVGLHPIHLFDIHVDADELGSGETPGFSTRKEVFDYQKYTTLAKDPKTVAIGECGLDYFRAGQSETDKQKEAEILRAQIRLAREVHKPLIIHCRNAYRDLYQILKDEKADSIGGTIHFFVGSWEEAQQFLDLGFHLSFTGVVTFTNDYNEVVKKAPLDRIMIETDAPYVAPVPYRGKRNEPLYVREIAARVAEIRGISFEDVARATTENARTLFQLTE